MTSVIIIIDEKNETISFTDSTNYSDLGISITDVNGVRFLFATYNSILNKSTVTRLQGGKEYKVLSGTLSVNGASYTTDMVFTAYETFDFQEQDCIVEETGWFCTFSNKIPSLNPNISNGGAMVNTFTPSTMGEDNTSFSDALRKVRYEIYTTYILGGVPLNSQKQYLVSGRLGASITLSTGETFYCGQVFTPSNDSVTIISGNGNVFEFKDTSTTNYFTCYNAQKIKEEYNLLLSNPTNNVSEAFRANYLACVSALALPYIKSFLGIEYSEAEIQNALDYVNGTLNTNKFIINA